ncbi:MAG: four helix bundle protein [Sedimentisphaerales bacterium]|jgi:four helix bundle protein
MTPEEMKKRTKQFGLDIILLVETLKNSLAARIIGGQLVRAATSVGANYRAACRGRSKREFIAKLGIVEEEADESAYWLEMLVDAKLVAEAKVIRLIKEANELVAITAASFMTAKTRS